jgi:ankyrin repeat protein
MKPNVFVLTTGLLTIMLAGVGAILYHSNARITRLEAELDRRQEAMVRKSPVENSGGDKGAKPKQPARWLYEAAGKGDVPTLRKILDENPDLVNSTPGNNHATPLHNACVSGQAGTVEELLRSGANINVQNDLGFTPVHDAISKGSGAVLVILLNEKANWTLKNKMGQTPLMYALARKKTELVEILKQYGVNE